MKRVLVKTQYMYNTVNVVPGTRDRHPSEGEILSAFVISKMGLYSTLRITVYRQVSNISRTKSQHLNDSRTVMRLSLPNHLKPDVKSRMKM